MFCIHWPWDALLYKTLMFWPFDWELFVHSLQETTISCSKRDGYLWCYKKKCIVQIWSSVFGRPRLFCVAHVMEILKTVWANGFIVPSLCLHLTNLHFHKFQEIMNSHNRKKHLYLSTFCLLIHWLLCFEFNTQLCLLNTPLLVSSLGLSSLSSVFDLSSSTLAGAQWWGLCCKPLDALRTMCVHKCLSRFQRWICFEM